MAFEFLKEMYRNSVMGMEAAREKEEARQRAIARQEEEERRIKRFRQYHLDKIHEECLDKFGEGFTGKVDLGNCSVLYPPDGLSTPREVCYSGKKYKETYNGDQKRFEFAGKVLESMPEGVHFSQLKLEFDSVDRNKSGFDSKKMCSYSTFLYKYTMEYAVTEEYASHIFSQCCTEDVIHDDKISDEIIRQASEFAERIWQARKEVIENLLAFIALTHPWEFGYVVTSSGIVGATVIYKGDFSPEAFDRIYRTETNEGIEKAIKYHWGIEEPFKKYGLSELDFVQRYGLALCLAKAAKPEGSKTFRYRLSCTPNIVCFSVVHLPVKESPKPEPILEAW